MWLKPDFPLSWSRSLRPALQARFATSERSRRTDSGQLLPHVSAYRRPPPDDRCLNARSPDVTSAFRDQAIAASSDHAIGFAREEASQVEGCDGQAEEPTEDATAGPTNTQQSQLLLLGPTRFCSRTQAAMPASAGTMPART